MTTLESSAASRPSTGDLSIRAVSKSFGTVRAVADVTLDIRAGEFFALLGPSGCGKTTLLRMIAGFEFPDRGDIRLDGVDITRTPPHRRPVNMMFQNYALFPHLDVAANIAFGLRQAGRDRSAIAARVDEMLALVQLESQRARRPDQLSGGQRQRVALARALACAPRVLLLDEPLTALDRKLREATRAELAALQRRTGITFVMVTHDQDEAMMMADRIGLMNAGALVQLGTPQDVYERPASRWAAQFIGEATFLDAVLGETQGDVVACAVPGLGAIHVDRARVPAGLAPGAAITLAIRPERLCLAAPQGEGVNRLAATLEQRAYAGSATHLRLRLANGALARVTCTDPAQQDFALPEPGGAVTLAFDPAAMRVLTE